MGNSAQTTVTTPLTLPDGRVCPVAEPWEIRHAFTRLTVGRRQMRIVAMHRDEIERLGISSRWVWQRTTSICPYLVTVLVRRGTVYYRLTSAAGTTEDAARSYGLRRAIKHATGIAL